MKLIWTVVVILNSKIIMKTIATVILFAALSVGCSESKVDDTPTTYSIQDFVGTYNLEGMCVDHRGYTVSESRHVVITIGVESDLLVLISSISDTAFIARVSNDSLFIPTQYRDDGMDDRMAIRGEGRIKKDSLFLNYGAGGVFGIIMCEIKGKKEAK